MFLETPKFRGSLGDFTPLALHETCTEAETESGRVEKEGKTRSLQLRTRYLRDTGTIEVFVRLRFVFLLSHEPTSPCNWRRGGSATLPWAKVPYESSKVGITRMSSLSGHWTDSTMVPHYFMCSPHINLLVINISAVYWLRVDFGQLDASNDCSKNSSW